MSGIPRPDPQIAAGTITVRVLRGAFDNPALEHPVSLEVTDAAGTKTETLTGKTVNQGRATFDGLLPWVGGRAIAKVELDGETLRSAPIDIAGDIGAAVMLVSGGAPAKRGPATGNTPLPGIAFEFAKVQPGELMVGAFDLSAKQAVEGVELTLHIRPPQGEPSKEAKISDAEGKAVFSGLDKFPKGTTFVAEAQLSEGDPVRRSEAFDLIAGKGMAVVLAKGRLAEAPVADPHAQAQQQRRRVPGPRSVPSLAKGTVRVRIIDGKDQPVAGQQIAVVMRDASQTEVKFPGTTNRVGIATLTGVDVRSDAFYYVRALYDQGPYRSGFFQMDKEGGIAVDLRVFETTQDPAAVKSAVQHEIRGGENDMAQVYRIFEVVVRGDKAFWVPGGMQISAPEGAKSVTVLRPAEPWLDHEGKAPYATLSRPIPPGEPTHLSMAWVASHSGEVEIEWTPPFDVLQSGVIVNKAYSLNAANTTKSEREPPDDEVELWELDPATTPIVFSVEGLPIRNPMFRLVGMILGSLLAIIAFTVLVVSPGRSATQRLVAQRDALVALLRTEKAGPRHERVVAALDRIYRRLDVLRGLSAATTKNDAAADEGAPDDASEDASDEASGDEA